ncbi:MAG: hypothetical protein PVI90_12235, partial [Desulfobacteraceae bacterium]
MAYQLYFFEEERINIMQIKFLGLLICLLSLAHICFADSFKDQKKAFDQIKDFSEKLCETTPLRGGGNTLNLTDQGESDIEILLKKLAKLGV